jgi:hypothetical protein
MHLLSIILVRHQIFIRIKENGYENNYGGIYKDKGFSGMRRFGRMRDGYNGREA